MPRDFRNGDELWKVLRVKAAFTDDDDWVSDVSDGVPGEDDCGSVPFNARAQRGKSTYVEFIVIPYVLATGLVVDAAPAQTFTYQPIYVHDVSARNRPSGSGLRGNGTTEEIATQGDAVATAEFSQHHRFPCDGADRFTIRLTSFSGTPAGADEMEIWYRCVVE